MNKKQILESAKGIVERNKEGSKFSHALQTVIKSLRNSTAGNFDAAAEKLSSYGASVAKKIEDMKEKQASLDPSDTKGQQDLQKNKEELLGVVTKMFSNVLDGVRRLSKDDRYVHNIEKYIEKLGMGLVESLEKLEKRIIAGVLLFKK